MIDIHNTENKDAIRDIVSQGMRSDFWEILCQVLDDNIRHQDEQINDEEVMDLDPVQYKTTMEILKGRKSDLQKLKELPEKIILDLQDPSQTEPDFDPYEKKGKDEE